MRDAFGGVFMIRLFLVFIFIFVAFAAVSLNYAKAFKLKNRVIDFVEKEEIIDLNNINLDNFDNEVLKNSNYNITCQKIGQTEGATKEDNRVVKYCHNGIVIEIDKIADHLGTTSKIINYNVYTYVDWNLGILNKILVLGGKSENSQERLNGGWRIKGEAKVVARDVKN